VSELIPLLFGPLRDHPAADAFARQVVRVHKRFATEVVYAHRLCPFLRDVDRDFGRFCVAMTERPDLPEARDAFIKAESAVLHMVYPLVPTAPAEFERFGGDVGRAARDVWRATPEGDARFGPEPPVIATFHPRLAGDRTSSHRMIGLLRRAPDPFVQVIPGGHYESGTVLAQMHDVKELTPETLKKVLAAVPPPPKDRAAETFKRLTSALLDEIAALVADIHADRDRSYAPFLKELGFA
jgi:hypothetical protein